MSSRYWRAAGRVVVHRHREDVRLRRAVDPGIEAADAALGHPRCAALRQLVGAVVPGGQRLQRVRDGRASAAGIEAFVVLQRAAHRVEVDLDVGDTIRHLARSMLLPERGDLDRQLVDGGLQRDLLVGRDAGAERRELSRRRRVLRGKGPDRCDEPGSRPHANRSRRSKRHSVRRDCQLHRRGGSLAGCSSRSPRAPCALRLRSSRRPVLLLVS